MTKIIIIEDDTAIAGMYKIKLTRDAGFVVLLADNGPAGLELVKKEKPDLILLDIVMPEMDGRAVLKELKKDHVTKDIPVVFLTNLGSNSELEKKAFPEAAGYLIKATSTPSDVIKKIKEVLCIQ